MLGVVDPSKWSKHLHVNPVLRNWLSSSTIDVILVGAVTFRGPNKTKSGSEEKAIGNVTAALPYASDIPALPHCSISPSGDFLQRPVAGPLWLHAFMSGI